MDADQLIAAACDASGLDDFGAPGWREGLDVLVDGLTNEAQLNDIGRPAAEVQVVGALSTRLQVTDWWNRHPELADQRIEAPLFIVGITRSGTTALSHLLSVDPAARSLRGWEAGSPIPPPRADTYETDERFVAAVAAEQESMLDALNPGFKAMHHEPPDMPTECVTVMGQDFVSLLYNALFNLDTYAHWLLERDHTATYEYHRRFLQLLQSEHPGRWVLKTPHHALAVETIAEVYPDARFIWTHRDPATCVASTASITRGLSRTFSDHDWAHSCGRLWTELLEEMVERLTAARTRLGDRFVDVDYAAMVADPVDTAAALYDDLDLEFTSAAESAMRRHSVEHRQHRHGRHDYTFDEFGLDRAELDDRFGPYRAAYTPG